MGQRQAKHADYSTALKDGNAERNRAKALMPGETLLWLAALMKVSSVFAVKRIPSRVIVLVGALVTPQGGGGISVSQQP